MRKKDYTGRIIHFFEYHPWWLRLLEWSKTHSMPGLKKIPFYNLITFIIKETNDDDLTTRANSMAFSFFMAIFPSIIVLFTLLPYTPVKDQFDDVLYQSIHEIMPGNAGLMVMKLLRDIYSIPHGGLMSLGFFLAFWFASNGMVSMMAGLDRNYASAMFVRRNWFQKRLIALQLTFLVGFILVASVVLVIMGNIILQLVFHYVKVDLITRFVVFAFRWIVVLLLFYATFSTIYRYGAATRQRISFFNPGALLATLLSVVTSWGFSFYVDNFGTYNKVYGSIGTLICLMVWIEINCLILLIGFELNAAIVVLRHKRLNMADGGGQTADGK
jgi:membrane protein